MPVDQPRRIYFPHRLPEVVKEWIIKEYPGLLGKHVKALVIFDERYSYHMPKAICSCGSAVWGDINELQRGDAMNRHVAEVIAETLEFEEKERKRRQDAKQVEFRRAWKHKHLKYRRSQENVGKVSDSGRPR